jgi:L-histidine Nalpha-methyltransferase
MPLASALRIIDTDGDGVAPAFREDVLAGLSQRQKAVPSRWFYDLRGSELFEEITRLPEYYPTRVETELLRRRCGDVRAATGPGRAVIEFGSGSSLKTRLLLDKSAPAGYVPIDISGEFLGQACADLAEAFPALPIVPVEADFMQPLSLPGSVAGLPRLGFFPGSTIGNMVPPTAVDLLRSMRSTLGEGAHLLIGFDRVKDVRRLLSAYDDAQGVTAQFNLNLLERINRELDADIAVEAFRHRVRWNESLSRIEMHLEATQPVTFAVSGQAFSMAAGETIHTENSHKYTASQASVLLLAGGWTPVHIWSDEADEFMLVLALASENRMAP